MNNVCVTCGVDISERVEIFKEIGKKCYFCLKCSPEQKAISFMVYGHKTAGTLLIVPQNNDGTNNQEKIRIAQRAYRRKR